jgi:hypothetical protein
MSIDEVITNYILTDVDIEYYFNQYCIKVYNKQYDYNLNNCKIFLNDLFIYRIFKSSYDRNNLFSFLNEDVIFIFNLDNKCWRNKERIISYLESQINGI